MMGAMFSCSHELRWTRPCIHVSALCMGVGEGPSSSLFSASGILQLLVVLQLLLKPKFSGVEKIKTIGSTYMAAAGLSAPSGHENQVLQACGKVNPIGHSQSYHLLKVLCQGAEAFCGIPWRPWWGQKPPCPWCAPSVKAEWSRLCNPCPAGPRAEACAYWSLGGI